MRLPRRRHTSGPQRDREPGQVLVLFALVLIVLLLVSALAVDYGGWLVVRRSYQNVADAASLAGAQQLTRPLADACPSGGNKNQCAREAAWGYVKSALGMTGLIPATQATGPDFTQPYQENGYRVWVASPPLDANVGCAANCPYPGRVSGPGVVFVRVERDQPSYFSRLASVKPNVVAWATAGRFPRNFAVIALCKPGPGENCLGGQNWNIQIDGGSTLVLKSGDLGTNTWTKTTGANAYVGLSLDGNAYMGMFDTCWNIGGSQCELDTWTGSAIDQSQPRNALPLGAPIVDPNYPLPPLGQSTPAQCGFTGSTASVDGIGPEIIDGSDWAPVAAVQPLPTDALVNGAQPTKISGTVSDTSNNRLAGATVSITAGPGIPYTNQITDGQGRYSFTVTTGGTFTIQASLPNYSTQTFTIDVPTGGTTNQDFQLAPNPGIIQGTVTFGGAGQGGVLITVSNGSTATTNASGAYAIPNVQVGTWTVTATLSGYVSNPNPATVVVTPGSIKTQDFTLTVAPPSGDTTGTITDSATGLQLPGATVTAVGPGGTYTGTSNANGSYTISNMTQGSYTFTVTRSGYTATSSTGTVPSGGTLTKNFALWPIHCGTGGNVGRWDCSYGAGGCPAVSNGASGSVTCSSFDDTNRIRPGTYEDITISPNQCAWIDPLGRPTRLSDDPACWTDLSLSTCPKPGIVHVTGDLNIGNNAFIFGDGVTFVLDHGAKLNMGHDAGFVLNYSTVKNDTPAVGTCHLDQAASFGATSCFRTVDDGRDYTYGAWTTEGTSPWYSCGTTNPPTVNTSCLVPGTLGLTWYLRDTPDSPDKRFVMDGHMGFLFDGVLYGPRDHLEIGGQGAQAAAGQIVGWTIKYHGGTNIFQDWWGLPDEGAPFLIEPVLGE